MEPQLLKALARRVWMKPRRLELRGLGLARGRDRRLIIEMTMTYGWRMSREKLSTETARFLCRATRKTRSRLGGGRLRCFHISSAAARICAKLVGG